MAEPAQLTLRCWLAWWLPPYLYGVAMCALITGTQPDPEKVARWVRRAMRFEVE